MQHRKDAEHVMVSERSYALLLTRHLGIWLEQPNRNNSDLISYGTIYRDLYACIDMHRLGP